MIRATTPLHIFVFKNNPAEYSRLLITYSQGGRIVMEKEKEDLTIEAGRDGSYSAWYRLTQEEANLFRGSGTLSALVQVRVLTEDGRAYASDKKMFKIEDVLNDEILTDTGDGEGEEVSP